MMWRGEEIMLMNDIIQNKRDNKKLSKEEIVFFVNGYTKGIIPDYQISALLMAICFNGMDAEETANLTLAMMNSGDVVDLSSIEGVKVDKHSTGGVGDKTSLVLGPMVSACGAKVAKMSGRGLGHTGGTLDKLEAIPGMQIQVPIHDFIKQVNDIGIAIVGQSANLVPADKKMYALRDVTATVSSIPLIASSIMSKKLATGSNAILLDVKFGSGAFFEKPDDARKLAEAMVSIGKHMNRDTRAHLTNMDQPLGLAIGNSLEVKEAIATLNGKGPSDLYDLCIESGETMLLQAKIAKTKEEAREMLIKHLNDGSALQQLVKMVEAQHGDASYILHPEKFPLAKHIVEVRSVESGYLNRINALELGEASMRLGGGRATKDDIIDYAAGILINKKCGDFVNKGEVLATLHTNHDDYSQQIKEITEAFELGETKGTYYPIIYDTVE